MSITQASELLVLPERYVEAKFDYEPKSPLGKLILDYTSNFDKYRAEGLAPALFGKAGGGKTYGAAVISRILVHKDIPVYWANTVTEINGILDLRDFRASKYFATKQRLLATDVLVLDDFGQLQEYPRIRELFFEIVDYRYAWKKPTIFTANFEIDGKEEEGWNEVTKCFSPALARRIRAMSKGLVYCI